MAFAHCTAVVASNQDGIRQLINPFNYRSSGTDPSDELSRSILDNRKTAKETTTNRKTKNGSSRIEAAKNYSENGKK